MMSFLRAAAALTPAILNAAAEFAQRCRVLLFYCKVFFNFPFMITTTVDVNIDQITAQKKKMLHREQIAKVLHHPRFFDKQVLS